MKSARLQPEQTKDEADSEPEKTRTNTPTASRPPLTFNDGQCPVFSLGQTSGSSHGPRSGVLQAKLTVGAPGDQYEQEADRVAEQVMRMTDLAPSPHKLGEMKSADENSNTS